MQHVPKVWTVQGSVGQPTREPDAKRQKQSTLGGASKDIDGNSGVVEDSLADEFEGAFDSIQTSGVTIGEEAPIND